MLESDIPEIEQKFMKWFKKNELPVHKMHLIYLGYLAYEEINNIPGEEKDDPNN